MKKVKRIFHPYTEWECYPAGFFKGTAAPLEDEEAQIKYRDFLGDLSAFELGMQRVLKEWPNSCEQFLSNDSMNRIAWLGQSAMCLMTGIPSRYRSGYKLLTEPQQVAADALAAKYLDLWLESHEA